MSSNEKNTNIEEYDAINNEDLQEKMKRGKINIIDIREPDEYREGHIPNAILMPLSSLENLIEGLDKEKEYHILCRTGRRVETSTKIFKDYGFKKIIKVKPGMSTWNGTIEKG